MALKPDLCFAMPAVGNDKTGKVCGQTTAGLMWLASPTELPAYAPAPGLECVAIKMACDIADIWSVVTKHHRFFLIVTVMILCLLTSLWLETSPNFLLLFFFHLILCR